MKGSLKLRYSRLIDLVPCVAMTSYFLPDWYVTVPLLVVRRYRVAEADGGGVGYLLPAFEHEYGFVTSLCVHPDHLRTGVGSLLMADMELQCLERRLMKVQLHVRQDNERAVAFYRRLEYQVIKTFEFPETFANRLKRKAGVAYYRMEKHLV